MTCLRAAAVEQGRADLNPGGLAPTSVILSCSFSVIGTAPGTWLLLSASCGCRCSISVYVAPAWFRQPPVLLHRPPQHPLYIPCKPWTTRGHWLVVSMPVEAVQAGGGGAAGSWASDWSTWSSPVAGASHRW